MTADTLTQDDLLVLLPRLRRYARVLTADLRLADDLVLETLKAASKSRSSRRSWPQLRHRLFAVMHRVQGKHLARAPHEDSPPLRTNGHDEMLERFSRLPADQREVLALVVLEGLPYTEIADVLDVPVGTVMSTLRNAREGIRSMPADS
jgi:RNA polymerase sigma-70 factor (ECF subfamily)